MSTAAEQKLTPPRAYRGALDQQLLTTGFSIPPGGVTGTQITFDYDSMPANQPSTYANTVFIWQTASQSIPINTQPKASWSVPTNQPNGSNVFTGLAVTSESYLLGYAVGPKVANICATVFVPVLGQGNPISQSPNATVINVGPTSLSFSYTMPQGSQPLGDGDWAGLWEGQGESVLYSVPPKWFTQIGLSSYTGNWAFNNVTILRSTPYTLGYFKGGWDAKAPKQTTLACSSTFTT
jgi:hypothetical protein